MAVEGREVLPFDVFGACLLGAVDGFALELPQLSGEAYMDNLFAVGGVIDAGGSFVVPNTIAGRALANILLLGPAVGVESVGVRGPLPERFRSSQPVQNQHVDCLTILRRVRRHAIQHAIERSLLWPSDPVVRAAQLELDEEQDAQARWRDARRSFAVGVRGFINSATEADLEAFLSLTGLDRTSALAFAQPYEPSVEPPNIGKFDRI